MSRTSGPCSRHFGKLGARPRALRRQATAYLTRHINDLHCIILASMFEYFAEGVFNGWVVAVYEPTVDEPDGK